MAFNDIHDLLPGFGTTNYNGIDNNAGTTNGLYIGNRIWAVAASCLTLEADSAPSTGATLLGNYCDQTNGTRFNGTKTGGNISTLYIRDTSLPGTIFQGNTFIMSPNWAAGFRVGATSAGDTSHDLTLSQFEVAYPGSDLASVLSAIPTKSTMHLYMDSAGASYNSASGIHSFAAPVKLNRLEWNTYSAGAGCTTIPVLTLWVNGTATSLTTTMTNGSLYGYVDGSISVASNQQIQIKTTGASGCSTSWPNPDLALEYQMQ